MRGVAGSCTWTSTFMCVSGLGIYTECARTRRSRQAKMSARIWMELAQKSINKSLTSATKRQFAVGISVMKVSSSQNETCIFSNLVMDCFAAQTSVDSLIIGANSRKIMPDNLLWSPLFLRKLLIREILNGIDVDCGFWERKDCNPISFCRNHALRANISLKQKKFGEY
jgi:hypothetical protein